MDKHPQAANWKSTMAASGETDGTLKHRFRDPALRGRVLAKTGTIKGVSTLAGYVTAESGKTYVFAILLNGRSVWELGAHAFQDRLVRSLVKFG